MTDEVAAFLREVPSFDRLDDDLLAWVAASVEERAYRAGDDVLIDDGPPAEPTITWTRERCARSSEPTSARPSARSRTRRSSSRATSRSAS